MDKQQLAEGWMPFDGDYIKKMQDIKLDDGTIILKCWPNAGLFICFSDNSIPDTEVSKVKQTRLHSLKNSLQND